MDCPSCGLANREGRKFCAACGGALAADCPSCGARNEPGERFCGECGGPLVGEARGGGARHPTLGHEVPESLAAGRYELRRFLGEGGRKRVYLGHDTSLDRDVAIALIKTEGLDDNGVRRARREAEAMGRLGDHPHIVTVHDIGEDGGRLFIVSQYMAGGDLDELRDAAEGRRLPLDRAIDIATQICRALEHAHGHGVVHRDVKPKNIWLTSDGTAKLGDFGLAVALDRTRITLDGMMVGTVAYMSPEQALGQAVDTRSDLYSLGALLYELVCGRAPFVGDDAVSIISQHINTAPVAPSWVNEQIPRALEELILGLLAKAPDKRPRSAALVRDTLEALSSGEFVAAEPIVHDRASPLERLAGGVFVGRERETEELRSSLEAVLSGRGRVVMVAGEMGIGKTRLASELGTYASLRGANVLWGRCYDGEGAPPYWPWVQIVRNYVHDRDPRTLSSEMGSGAAEIAQVVSEVRDRLPGLPQPVLSEPEQARFRLFDAISTFLRSAAASAPIVLILDDLHWADRASVLLLQFLAVQLRSARIMVLGTYRDADIDESHPLSELLATLRREPDHKRVLLRGLSHQEAQNLLEATAEHELGPREARMVRLMYEQTEGNPFFIEEVIRHLVETRQLNRREGRWVIDVETVEEVGIPQGVKETIGQRLARLSADCIELLTVAAVIGREFTVDQLRHVTGRAPQPLLATLDEALGRQIITEVAGSRGRYRFAHGLTRETLYGQLSASRRIALHGQIAEALEELHSDSIEAHLPELAYHANEAILVAGAGKAIDYSVRAAERAMGMLAYEDAMSDYEAALRALQSQPDEKRQLELLLALGDSCWRSGAFEKARENYRAAAAVAKRRAAAEELAIAALGYGGGIGYGIGRTDDVLVGLLEDALAALGEADSPLRARVMTRLGEELFFSDSRERAQQLTHDAISMARRTKDAEALAFALNRAWAMSGPDELEERTSNAREAIGLAEGVGDQLLTYEARAILIGALLEAGDIAGVDRELALFARAIDELPISYVRWALPAIQAMRLVLGGHFEEGAERALDALRIGQDAQNLTALLPYGVLVGLQRREQGPLEGLIEGAEAFAEQYPALPVWRCGLAQNCSELGREQQARDELTELSADSFGRIPRDAFWLLAISQLAQAAFNLDERDHAAALYELLEPYGDRVCAAGPGFACYGVISRHLGQLATTLERFEAAEHHFEQAIELSARIDGPAWLVHSQIDYARMLLRRDAPGDRRRAVELLSIALEKARELKMTTATEAALALKLEAQGIDTLSISTSIDAVQASVQAQRPDLRSHAAPDGTVTLLFTDIEGSTAMTELLGDRRWLELLGDHNKIVRDELRAYEGFEVKSQGDGFMIAFASAGRALLCAVGIQRAIDAFTIEHPVPPLRVRIGLHTGEAIREGDDFFGRDVILAARIAAHARGGEILVSSLLKALVEPSGEWTFGDEREIELKGLRGKQRLTSVRWQPEPAPVAS